jgi:DNA-binding Lrp family transcriptional regulator
MFEAAGLSVADGELYATVVRLPRRTVAELAEQCGLSVPQVRRRLSRLTTLGMVNRLAGREARYLAVSPDLAISGLIAQREQALWTARAAANQLMAVYRESARTHSSADLVEVVTGAETIANQVEQVHQTARTEIRVFDKPPYARNPDQHRESAHEEIRQGITYRILYDRAALTWPGRLVNDVLPTTRNAGQAVHARVRPSLPIKLFLADREIAVVHADSTGLVVDTAYVIHHCALLDALAALFDAEWNQGTSIHAGPDSPASVGPDDPAVRLLALLSAGFTDERIARSLGCSPRTAQRRVAQLMDALGVTTRFQLALRARDQGWL